MGKRTSVAADLERYWSKVDQSGGEDACWEWTGTKLTAKDNRAVFHVHGHPVIAARWGWTHTIGPIPDGLFLLHSCDNPSCVNFKHLRPGTHAENMDDRNTRGRQYQGDEHWSRKNPEMVPRGEAHPQARLTAADVLAIREMRSQGRSLRHIANAFAVDAKTVHRVVQRKTWTHI